MVKTNVLKFKEVKAPKLLKLDLGAGKGANTPEDFVRVDIEPWEDNTVVDLSKPWPWGPDSVDEARCMYLIHYLKPAERVHFFNELHRVLKPGAKVVLHTPHWCAAKAYLDMRVQFPPVSESFYYTLQKGWRESQNEVDRFGLTCDFEVVIGYGLHPAVAVRHQERAQEQMAWHKEAAQELIATLTKV